MLEIDEIIYNMYHDVVDNPVNHHRVRKHFPRECVHYILSALADLERIGFDRHTRVDLKLDGGLCIVEFTHLSRASLDEVGAIERKVREDFHCEVF